MVTTKRFPLGLVLILVVVLFLLLYVGESKKQAEQRYRQLKESVQTSGKVTIRKGSVIRLLDNLQLKLVETNVPDERCRDCITSAKLQVSREGKNQDIVFRSGGIAGIVQNTQGAFGYSFTMEEITSTSVTLYYQKKQ